ncbi:MAG: bifunctional diaminohydroxyphosphoribosylaminopyrimidine deaminase/5-amino-6-(5-phosphoribosylamino)uracil reductase RibD [Candidatus Omnitrophota bacterium]|nr:MAG: bifunctional diaminohydroxyphosphoribosylaminopyrimidine deaminase/5-amino-6-(5-phosphoribosylamino)uracil reductase RibD [Candidatus Omnitrophota bacterium]
MQRDIYFMQKAIRLAEGAEGFTSPNPLVGAVIVKNNKVIGSGYHRRCGLPHAEIEAMRKTKQPLRGSQLFVNLEPCCHFGRTPPCVDEIIKAGITQVVIATIDPNPQVNGKSIKKLKAAGVKIKVGVCEAQARQLNEVFFTNIKKKRPFVVVKTAQSLDGKIATKGGLSKWISSEQSRVFAKSLRDRYDAVLVGINTVIKDNPTLNGLKKMPYKVVIDPQLRIPLNSNLIKNNNGKLIVVTSYKNRGRKKASLANVVFVKEKNGKIFLKEALKKLYELGIMSVFVEGGSVTEGRFFDGKLVDKIYFFVSPKIIGGRSALTSVGGEGFLSPHKCPHIKNISIKQLEQDIFITGYPNFSS